MKIFVLTTLFVIIAAATAAEAGVSSAISKSTQHDIDADIAPVERAVEVESAELSAASRKFGHKKKKCYYVWKLCRKCIWKTKKYCKRYGGYHYCKKYYGKWRCCKSYGYRKYKHCYTYKCKKYVCRWW